MNYNLINLNLNTISLDYIFTIQVKIYVKLKEKTLVKIYNTYLYI